MEIVTRLLDGGFSSEGGVSITSEGSGLGVVETGYRPDGGGNEAYKPVDLFVMALGSCMLQMSVGAGLARGVDMGGSYIRTQYRLTGAGKSRRFGEIELDVHFPSTVEEERVRGVLELAAAYCPVGNSLNPDIEVRVTFHYDAGIRSDS